MKARVNVAAALVAGGVALGASQLSATPAFDHALPTTTQAAQPEQVRWVCGPCVVAGVQIIGVTIGRIVGGATIDPIVPDATGSIAPIAVGARVGDAATGKTSIAG
jgi:hypothetical protein